MWREWYNNHKPTYHLLSRTRLVSDTSITKIPTICSQERDWWVIYQSQNLPTICSQERDWWVIHQSQTYLASQTYLPFVIKNVTGEWYINHKPTCHLLSRTRLVSDTSITNLPNITNLSTICYQKCDWWMIYQSQTYLPFSLKKIISG